MCGTRLWSRLAVGRKPAFLTKWASLEDCLNILTTWHQAFPKQGTQESMWEASVSLTESQSQTLSSLQYLIITRISPVWWGREF